MMFISKIPYLVVLRTGAADMAKKQPVLEELDRENSVAVELEIDHHRRS